MMKKIYLLFCFWIAGVTGFAQGIVFEQGNFDEVLQKAELAEKLIFIDVYTSWCGPCKIMEKNVFPDAEVGLFYNRYFVCFKVDAEKEGKDIAARYGVDSYPHYLFLDADGKLVYKAVGGRNNEDFIAIGQKAIDEFGRKDNYTAMKEQYETRKNDAVFLRKYILKSVELEVPPVDAIEDYLKVQQDFAENNVEMMEFFLKYGKYMILGGKTEQIFREHHDEFMAIADQLEELTFNDFWSNMIFQTKRYALNKRDRDLYDYALKQWILLPENKNNTGTYIDYQLDFLQAIKDVKKYMCKGKYFLDSISSLPMEGFRLKDSVNFATVSERMKNSKGLLTDLTLERAKHFYVNQQVYYISKVGKQYAKYASEMSKKRLFKDIMPWAEYAYQLNNDHYSAVDFYANALYLTGKRRRALVYKQQALDMLTSDYREEILVEYEKMKKGEKLF